MKVLHVIWDLGLGGAQTYLVNLVKTQLADADLQPELIVLSDQGVLSAELDKLVPVVYLGMRSGYALTRVMSILRAIGRSEPDVVHSHSNCLMFNAVLRFAKVPVVYTEHGGGLLGGRARDRLVYRYLTKPFCRLVAISEEMSRVMVSENRTLKERIDVVYNGVDIERIDMVPVHDGQGLDRHILDAKYRIGIIGRLEKQKGVDFFLLIAARLTGVLHDVVFVIIGDGTLRTALQEQARQLGIADRTYFLGYRIDAVSLLKTFDVFLFTSDYEPFGLVIVEAMAACVPVVALHNRGAVPEIITHDVDGIIVQGKYADELAASVQRLLIDKEARRRIVSNAKQTVLNQFTIRENAEKITRIYKACLA